jgi:hypothetical protein
MKNVLTCNRRPFRKIMFNYAHVLFHCQDRFSRRHLWFTKQKFVTLTFNMSRKGNYAFMWRFIYDINRKQLLFLRGRKVGVTRPVHTYYSDTIKHPSYGTFLWQMTVVQVGGKFLAVVASQHCHHKGMTAPAQNSAHYIHSHISYPSLRSYTHTYVHRIWIKIYHLTNFTYIYYFILGGFIIKILGNKESCSLNNSLYKYFNTR